jgi:hypothetical protein
MIDIIKDLHLFIFLSFQAPPVSLVDGANKKDGQAAATPKKSSSGKPNEQRYFRIPFLRPNERNRDTNGEQKKKGWWYAHFDGKIIVIFSCFSKKSIFNR